LIDPKRKIMLFDEWPEEYDRWFATPMGALVKKYEGELLLELLKPMPGESILDAGCGTGVFTLDVLSRDTTVIGLDISLPMLKRAGRKARRFYFHMVLGEMLNLPFPEKSFDRVMSVTALEFIEDAQGAFRELFRVTKRNGCIVVATLNSLSPWAARRKRNAKEKQTIFEKAIFRSPDELRSLAPVEGVVRTAIHFQKEDNTEMAAEIEREGRRRRLDTGAFVAGRWEKK
jgi:ubiquinone/menaquinone biosynthesis C-methylase UbiE